MEYFEASQVLAISGVWSGVDTHLRFDPHLRTCEVKDAFYATVDRIQEKGFDISSISEPLKNSHDKSKHDVAMTLMKWLDHNNYKWH